MHKPSINQLSYLLAPLVIGHAFAMDIYVPALSHMTSIFKTSPALMLMTLTVFMLTAGLMQLVAGPLSDWYGRRRVAYCVLFIFGLGSVLCALSTHVYFLIAARIIQSTGSAGMMVVGFSIVRDFYQGRESAKVFATLNGLIAMSPMFAPYIGSMLDVYWGWQSVFLSLLLIVFWGVANLTLGFGRKIVIPPAEPLTVRTLGHAYIQILGNRTFCIYTLLSALGLSYLYLFCAMSPYLIIEHLNIPETQYGYYFAYMGLSFLMGSFLCRILVGRLGIYLSVVLGLMITLLGGLAMTLLQYKQGLTLAGFIYPMLMIGVGGTLSMGAGNAGAMTPFSEHIGTASSIGGAFRFLFPALLGFILLGSHLETTYPLGLSALIFSLVGLILMLFQNALFER